MSAWQNIQLDPLSPVRPVVNNLLAEGGVGVIDLRSLSRGQPVKRTSLSLMQRMGTGLKFVTTAAMIFSALFVAVNWQAYGQKFSFWYQSVNPDAEKTQEQKLLASILDTEQKNTVSHDRNFSNAATVFADTVEQMTTSDDIDFSAFEVAPPDDYLVIPRLGITVPVQRPPADKLIAEDWAGLEKQIQEYLRNGVVQYPGTAAPGMKGNFFVTGHSSYYPWDSGDYKAVFALLSDLKVGDQAVVWHEGVKFVYEVFDIQTVPPTNVDVLKQTGNEFDSMMSLMTCTPVGTAKDRLIVRFKQLSPDPARNEEMSGDVAIGGTLVGY